MEPRTRSRDAFPWPARRLGWLGVVMGLLLSGSAAAAQGQDSLVPASVYVPAPCAGTPAQRCPLVVFLQVPARTAQSASAARAMIEWQRVLADKYGAIFLVHDSAVAPVASRDSLLQRTLRTYAIDPDRVALVGYRVRLDKGCPDPQVFSRIALLSPNLVEWGSPVCQVEGKGLPRAARVYLDGGLGDLMLVQRMMGWAPKLRQAKHSLELVLALRGYAAGPAEFERLWRWLDASWAASATAASSAANASSASAATAPGQARSPAGDDFGPLLTVRAIEQLTTFWSRFQREPDSIRTTARLAHQQRITVPVWAERLSLPAWTEHFSLLMMDTPALAAQYPSVRAALQAAGLTAQQADAYRRALIVAAANRLLGDNTTWARPIVTGTTQLDKNIVFLQTHSNHLKALGATGMWLTP